MKVQDILTSIRGHEITLLSTDGLPYNASMYEKDGKIYDEVTEKCISDFQVVNILATGVYKLMLFIEE